MSFMVTDIEKKSGYDPLESGRYDATLHCIIALERQKTVWEGKETVKTRVLMIFEIPSIERSLSDGTKAPALQSYEITWSASMKGNCLGVINAITHDSHTEESLYDFITNEDSIKSLLGKPCVVDVTKKLNKKGNMANYVNGILELDVRLPQPVPHREPFIFTAKSPDLEIFKQKLLPWTRDKLMSAVNSDEFPKELHKAYRDIKEQEAASSGNQLV